MIGNSSLQRKQRLRVYASFYGIPAPEKVPYQKGYGLYPEGYEVNVTEVMHEHHSQYLEDNSYSPLGEEGEMETVIAPNQSWMTQLSSTLRSRAYGITCLH